MGSRLHFRSAGVAALGALSCAWAATARAEGFELQTLDPALAGDTFVLTPDASSNADHRVLARLLVSDAYKSLLRHDVIGGTRDVVSSQVYVNAGGVYGLGDRAVFGLNVPFVPHQAGNDVGTPDSAGMGDLRLAARGTLLPLSVASLGVEGRFFLPTGNAGALTGEGSVRGSIHFAASGRVSLFRYAGSFGYLGRPRHVVGGSQIGPSLPFSLGAGVAFAEDRAFVGVELQGMTVVGNGASVFADRTTPMVGLLEGRYRVGPIAIGLGFGPGLTRAPGAAPHVLLTLGFEPEKEQANGAKSPEVWDEPEPEPLPPKAAPPPPPPPPPPEQQAVPEPLPPPTAAPVPVEPAPQAPKDDAAVREEARRLFQQGVVAYDKKKYAEARAVFGKAYAMKPHPIVLLNLAQSELMDGALPEACRHFQEWKLDAENPAPAVKEQAEQGIRQACH